MKGFGSRKKIKGSNGENYTVVKKTNGYKVTNMDRKISVDLIFDEESSSWYVGTGTESIRLITFLGGGQCSIPLSGEEVIFSIDIDHESQLEKLISDRSAPINNACPNRR